MEAKELRIGNYLYDGVGGIIKVEVDDLYDNVRKYYEPIELTEEILLKCGFKKGLKYFSYKDFDIDLKGWFGFNNMVANANIKQLHQLQNLYFALTGEELEINL